MTGRIKRHLTRSVSALAIIGSVTAAVTVAAAQHQDTSPKDIQKWFQSLTNRMGGSCCGEGDGYEAAIDVEATPEHKGRGHIIDPSGKEIWVGGFLLKKKPALHGDLTFTFTWEQMAKEKYGNPFDHAWVFVSVTNGEIDHRFSNGGVWCVVPLYGSV